MDEKILAQKTKLFEDAIGFNKPERIPHYCQFTSWIFHDCGNGDIYRGYDDMEFSEKAQKEFFTKYKFDAFDYYNITMQGGQGVFDCLGGKSVYNFSNETGTVSIPDHNFCTLDDIDEYLADPYKYQWKKIMPNKVPNWNNMTVGDLEESINRYNVYSEGCEKINNMYMNVNILPNYRGMVPMSGLDSLFLSVLGIKESSVGLRRHKEKMKQVCEIFDESMNYPMVDMLNRDEIRAATPYAMSDAMFTAMCHTFLSLKQYEEFCYPLLKKVLDKTIEQDFTLDLFYEGHFMRFGDYFADIPKGKLSVHMEQDDLYEMRKKYPNICIIGGLTRHILAEMSPEKSIDEVKRYINDFGADGGAILGLIKAAQVPKDCNPENLKAVCDFVADYKL